MSIIHENRTRGLRNGLGSDVPTINLDIPRELMYADMVLNPLTTANGSCDDLTSALNNHLDKVADKYISKNIKKVIFNNPATIVIWDDGSKTVVKCGENDIYDPEKGMAMAICKKALGNEGNYYNLFKKWLPEDYQEDSTQIAFSNLAYVLRKHFDVTDIMTIGRRYISKAYDRLWTAYNDSEATDKDKLKVMAEVIDMLGEALE